MKKVLLTGATGLIGKYAIDPLLKAGFEVFAVSKKSNESKKGLHWVEADLMDIENVKSLFEKIKPDYLLHFAWDTTPGTYLESDINFNWLKSSMEMLNQFKINGGKRSVFAGTCFEYEFQDSPLTEYGKLNPTSTYAKCKNQLNDFATKYAEENNMSFGWGRIFYVFGENENEKRLVAHVINNLKNNKEVLITVPELVKDYMFAGDIAEGFVKFLDSDVKGCVNICTGNLTSVKDVVSIIAKKLSKEHLVKYTNEASNQPKIILGDNTRLAKEVGYTPSHSLEEGLEIVINS